MKLYSRQEMQKGLKKRPIDENLVICTQSLLWHPKCEKYGCDLRPDRKFYPEIQRIGPLDDAINEEQKKEIIRKAIEKKDIRTNPYNPICFRCGMRWGACAD